MKESASVLLTVDKLSKKFCRDLKRSLLYSMADIGREILRRPSDPTHLRKDEFWALDEVSFKLYEGEILSVIGTNGSGKTTLMRVISDIFPKDKGEIIKHHVERVTPIFALHSGINQVLTGHENIQLKGAMLGMGKEELEEKKQFIEDFSELGKFLNAPVGTYSSGMRARLAYAISIATEPNLFIIDEALAVGDSAFKAKCYNHLKQYVKEKPHRSVLYVTNRVKKILTIADRTLVLHKGQLVKDATDLQAALEFYINNCLKDLEPHMREEHLQLIREYEG
jgi:lipopolysaccharide transport system ATP-binding protein